MPSSSLLIDIQTGLVALALIAPRAVVCLTILPGFGGRTLVGMMRSAVPIGLALPAFIPTYLHVRVTPPDYFLGFVLSFKEAMIGLMLGAVLSIPFWVTQAVGSILDTQRMPIQIQSSNASIDPDASALGAMLLQAVVVLTMQAGLFLVLARILLESYSLWPAFALNPPFEPGHLDVLLKKFGEFFWYVVVYGGPVLIPLLLVDFAFAVLGVFASNLQVSFMSAPVKSLMGLFILLVYWPIFSHYVASDFSGLLDVAANMLHVTRGR